LHCRSLFKDWERGNSAVEAVRLNFYVKVSIIYSDWY